MDVQENSEINEILMCEKCGNSVNQNRYENHLKNHSRSKKVETCPYCFKQFTNISNFKYHLAHHGTERPWLCNECNKSYKTRIDLLQHQKSHDKMREPFSCEICRELFKTRSSFNVHMRKHSSVKGPQECRECNKSFINLRSHVQQVHERIRRYICSICEKSFGKKSGLDRHVQTVHEKLRNFPCDLCEKSFGEKIQMQRHRNIHFKKVNDEPDYFDDTMIDEEIIEGDKRFIVCGICKRKLNSMATLKRHKMTVHEKKRPWLCDLCPKSYSEKTNLMRHINRNHLDDEIIIEKLDEAEVEESFECRSCRKILNTPWGLKMHEEECHLKSQIKFNENIEQVHTDADNISGTIEALEDVNEEVLGEDVSNEIHDLQYVECNQEENSSSFTCNFCNIKFKAKRYHLQHLRTFHNDESKNLLCRYCNEVFTHRCQRLRHVRKIHPEVFEDNSKSSKISEEKSNRSCKICAKVFKTEKFLQVHNSTHHKSQSHECPVCSKKFSFKQSLERHLRAIHEDRRDFKCSDCERAFRSQYELNQHHEKLHVEVRKKISVEQLTCGICDKICSSRKVLYSHKKYVHEGIRWGSSVYKCKLCLEKFDSKYKKSKHWHQVHRNGEIQIRTCHYCNSNFELYEDFKSHIESHSECLICLTCGSFFPDSSALLLHSESHRQIDEDLRQFICDVCSHRLSTKGQLEVHMKKHFNDCDQFVCDICGKSYKFMAPFLHHKLTHKNTFDFHCSHCQKPFRKKRDMMLHERVHTGERPYKCQTCSKSFAQKQNYLKHIKTHQMKIIECRLCGTSINSSAKLRQHEIKEHPEEFPFKCGCGKIFKTESAFKNHDDKCQVKIKFSGNEIYEEIY